MVVEVYKRRSDYGLKLTLNVEQYEYMPGPHDAAGVKILLHDQREFPKVAELGLAIPTGTHTYVGIQLLRIQNLPEPHGTCRSQDSPYYTRYSPEACQLACMSERMGELCGCRHMYMPHVKGEPPICTLKQYLECYSEIISEVKDYVRDNCKCPVPCDFLIYDPTISFASTSVYATERLLASTASANLHQKFMKASSYGSLAKFRQFRDLAVDMRVKVHEAQECYIDNVDVRSRLIQQHDTPHGGPPIT
ncbi:hypothetical protein RRG08_040650 [Elysia crispata]|uniref:Amiloride-sensitive sodium channel n=1 Tax=Elysia crispata TaxID=231223 RepID=A0AAE0YYQ0_9GAST|nr:hypothetical protein RRG08_040650 [Elysia crispata]